MPATLAARSRQVLLDHLRLPRDPRGIEALQELRRLYRFTTSGQLQRLTDHGQHFSRADSERAQICQKTAPS